VDCASKARTWNNPTHLTFLRFLVPFGSFLHPYSYRFQQGKHLPIGLFPWPRGTPYPMAGYRSGVMETVPALSSARGLPTAQRGNESAPNMKVWGLKSHAGLEALQNYAPSEVSALNSSEPQWCVV
jgi:hypothetical protein